MMRRSPAVRVVVLGLALALTGCSGSEDPVTPAEPSTAEATGGDAGGVATLQVPGDQQLTVLVRTASAEGTGDALVSGELTASGECVGVQVEEAVYPLVFPEGTAAQDTAVVLPDGTSLEYASTVRLGGGFHTSPLPDGTPEVPSRCAGATGEVVVVDGVG